MLANWVRECGGQVVDDARVQALVDAVDALRAQAFVVPA
jgi:hypothetical protein